MLGTGDLKHRGDASARELAGFGDVERVLGGEGFELDALFQPIPGDVVADSLHHHSDRLFYCAVVDISVDQAVHGVAHQGRRVCGVEDYHGLAALRAADRLQCGGGGFDELVEVGTRSRPSRARRDRRDDLGIGDEPDLRNRGDDRHRGLATARHHIEVGCVEMVVEVDHGHAVGADRGGCQIEHAHPGVLELDPIRAVGPSGGGVEDKFDIAEVWHRT